MKNLIAVLVLNVLALGTAQAQSQGLFDVEQRRAALAQPAQANAKASCLAVQRDPAWSSLKPVEQLRATEGYGTDGSANDYAWAVMVLTGRALAGDAASEADLRDLLLKWANAKAFDKTQVENDSYYALKRVLLPTVVAYSVLERRLSEEQKRALFNWIDPLVRRTDWIFDGTVDHNNHRYLTDSLLMTWGAVTGDEELYAKGYNRYRTILKEARSDGSLALETRRGARALWYMRQSLASLAVMAEVAATRGTDLYGLRENEVNFDRILAYLMNGLAEPKVVLAYASENYIPGGEDNYREQDLGFLVKRGHGRHYMAWAEPVLARERPGLSTKRLKTLFTGSIKTDRPLIDEFIGGNATCFWGQG